MEGRRACGGRPTSRPTPPTRPLCPNMEPSLCCRAIGAIFGLADEGTRQRTCSRFLESFKGLIRRERIPIGPPLSGKACFNSPRRAYTGWDPAIKPRKGEGSGTMSLLLMINPAFSVHNIHDEHNYDHKDKERTRSGYLIRHKA